MVKIDILEEMLSDAKKSGSFPPCSHDLITTAFITYPTRGFTVWDICLICGRKMKQYKKQEVESMNTSSLPNFTEYEADDYHAYLRRFYEWQAETNRNAYAQERAEKDAAWLEWYNTYLKSPAWRFRRDKVLNRDKWICQGCLTNRATQVHHLTYAHVGNEPLFDLVSICDTCHDSIPNKFTGEK